MLKKEISDVLRHNFFFILLILLLPAFLVVTRILPDVSYFSVFFPIFQFLLFFWAFFMGTSLFSVEQGQRGLEYLLSLPLSRYKLIGLKILPRFIAILIFYLIFLILYLGEGHNNAALSLVAFTTIYFSFYLISLSFSASSDNFLVLFVVSLLSLFIFLALGYFMFWLTIKLKGYIYYVVRISPFITGELESFIVMLIPFVALCLLFPLLIAFVLSVKKFDIRPSRVFNTRFIKIFAPLFILGLLASFLFANQIVYMGGSSYYLTRDYKLVEYNYYFGFRIYDGQKVHKIKVQYNHNYPFAEEENYIYGKSYNTIFRINTSDYEIESLYKPPQGRYFTWTWKARQTIAFMEYKGGYSGRQLVFLDTATKKVSRMPLDHKPLKGYYGLRLIGADRLEGKGFWLLYAWSHEKSNWVFRLWEDGKIEHIKETQYFPLYVKPYLITHSEKRDILISEDREGQFETIQKIPNSKGYLFFGLGYYPWFRSEDFGDVPVKEIYGRKYRPREEREKGPLYARLDLEIFEIEELSDTKEWLYCFTPDKCYFEDKDYDAGTFAIYRFQDGQSTLIRSFRISFEKTFYPYKIFESGIVLEKGKKVRVYAFPDLEEIKFKKL